MNTRSSRYIGRHAKCRDSENCTGPGCRVVTGKTVRKNNAARPHPNKAYAEGPPPAKQEKGSRR